MPMTRNSAKDKKHEKLLGTKRSHSTGNEESVDTVVSSSVVKDKKIKQFDFFFLRTCFRTMNEFYKSEYQQYFNKKPELAKSNLTLISKDKMDKIIAGFIS